MGYKPLDSGGQFQYKTVDLLQPGSVHPPSGPGTSIAAEPTGEAPSPTAAPTGGFAGGRVRLNGLRPFTHYQLIVQAFNSIGAGPRSDPITAATAEDGKLIYF